MEPARTGLRQLMADLLRGQPAEDAVLLAWPLVCGKEVAARSTALTFIEGKLVVEVPDTTWRSQLQSFAPRYMSEYQNLLGPAVRGIEFKLKQSAVDDQRSGKPVRSVSADDTTANAKSHVTSNRFRKKS